MKTWFITGVSPGLGLALVRVALSYGDTMAGTARTGNAYRHIFIIARLQMLDLD
jgi:NAD(P)-dependent dehydrogenase (short-subunit alcohol dehydrogenase family)